ncbi:MAG: hypothetical protein AAGB46_15995 [Verrucomicrobiota bacterium]
MDSINSNPYFNHPRISYQPTPAQQAGEAIASSHVKTDSTKAVPQANQSEPFSSMFNDDELAKLQGNLEKIAAQAERALKRFSSNS